MNRLVDLFASPLACLRAAETVVRRFASDQAGVVAIIVGLAFVPLAGMVGASMDYSRAANIRGAYQDATDAAALAVATSGLSTFGQRQDFARAVVAAHVPARGHELGRVDLHEADGEFRVDAIGAIQTALLGIMGVEEIDVGTQSVAVASSGPVELAIVFDATNSMRFGNRWQVATTGVNNLPDHLDEIVNGRQGLMVTLIPMSDRINLERGYRSWMDGGAPNRWTGCFEPRIEPIPGQPYRVTNATPREMPFVGHTRDTQVYVNPNRRLRPSCPNELAGPTHNINTIMRTMHGMTTHGTGRFDEGMAWPWRALSPSWRGEWHGAGGQYPADADEARKAVLFVSDGNSTIEVYDFDGDMEYGWNNGGAASFDALVAVCENMQAQGIEIFMFYVAGNPHARPYFQDCATSPTHFFDVTEVSRMEEAFSAMTGRLTDVRLVR